jgi:hypothetical protein
MNKRSPDAERVLFEDQFGPSCMDGELLLGCWWTDELMAAGLEPKLPTAWLADGLLCY